MAENSPAFDPKLHMKAPFEAFMEAAQQCADNGWLVFIRPEKEGSDWRQQLLVVPASSMLAESERSNG